MEGKEILTGNVKKSSKDAIVKAVVPILGERGTLTKLLQRIGDDFDGQIKHLEETHGQLPECELKIQLIPKS